MGLDSWEASEGCPDRCFVLAIDFKIPYWMNLVPAVIRIVDPRPYKANVLTDFRDGDASLVSWDNLDNKPPMLEIIITSIQQICEIGI